ncbi:MAG: hypothetical protein ACI9YO_002004 [Gammaproteobacteria bacterium]|jgi:hypothetical protein
MRKTDKKIDNQLRLVLTDVCEFALEEIDGFQWLTHLVNYSDFPKSLKVVCVFDTNENLSGFMSQKSKSELTSLIQAKLQDVDVKLKNVSDHISYDTEQNCEKEHHGQWADRLG